LAARAIRDAEEEDSRHGQRRPPNPNHRLPAQLDLSATSGGPARSDAARLLRFLRATHGDIFAKSWAGTAAPVRFGPHMARNLLPILLGILAPLATGAWLLAH
jgi:hypothetical protein